MKTSYQVFSLGLLLALGTILSAAFFQGHIRKEKLEAHRQAAEIQPLIMLDSFMPIEHKTLPAFRHLVIDCPEVEVSVYHSNAVSDARFLHQFKNASIDQLFTFRLVEDTLYVATKRDANNVPIYYETHGGLGRISQEGHLIRLGLRSPGLQSIRVEDQTLTDIFFQRSEYSDSLFSQVTPRVEVPLSPFNCPRLDIYFAGVTPSSLYLDAQEVNLYFPDLGPAWNTGISLYGKTETLRLFNPSFSIGGNAYFTTDSLLISGKADYIKGRISAQAKRYLEIDVQPKKRLEIAYQAVGESLVKKIKANSYTLIRQVE